MSSFSHLQKYTSTRYGADSPIREILDRLDELDERDANLATIAMFSHRSQTISPRKVVTGSHLHAPSEVDQRTFHALDHIIFKSFPELTFIEMSPVQPIGLNTVIAGLSQNKILATVRSSEVNADITTSIFRDAYFKYLRQNKPYVEAGGISRIVRAQKYNPKTKFLPHFRMFGHVTVGRSGANFKSNERGHLLRHICRDIDLMYNLMQVPASSLKELTVELGDARIMQKLISLGKVDGREIRRHTTDPDYHVFKEFGIDLPESFKLDDPDLGKALYGLGLSHVADELAEFYEQARIERPDVANMMTVSMSRIADTGYYRGICFNIYGSQAEGLRLPIANGGYTDWAEKVNNNPKELCIISGIGEELIARYFYPSISPPTLDD